MSCAAQRYNQKNRKDDDARKKLRGLSKASRHRAERRRTSRQPMSDQEVRKSIIWAMQRRFGPEGIYASNPKDAVAQLYKKINHPKQVIERVFDNMLEKTGEVTESDGRFQLSRKAA